MFSKCFVLWGRCRKPTHPFIYSFTHQFIHRFLLDILKTYSVLDILPETSDLDMIKIEGLLGFPRGSTGKESTCSAGDLGSTPGLGRSAGEGNGYPLQYSGLENSRDCMGSQRVGHDWLTFTFKTESFLYSEHWPCSGQPNNKLINIHRNKVIFDTKKSKKLTQSNSESDVEARRAPDIIV